MTKVKVLQIIIILSCIIVVIIKFPITIANILILRHHKVAKSYNNLRDIPIIS